MRNYIKPIVVVIVAVATAIIGLMPISVWAWPEPKYYGHVVVWNGQGQSGFENGRWSTQLKYCFQVEDDVPPQLDLIQAGRWRSAWPINRVKLAERYGVPRDIAEKYGAVYKDYDVGIHNIE